MQKQLSQCSICRGLGCSTPTPLVPLNPPSFIDPQQNGQKYIADPLSTPRVFIDPQQNSQKYIADPLSTPQVFIDPQRNSQKYISDPPLVLPQIDYWTKYKLMKL